jgi:ethanolaminephosphotransferase
MNIGRSWWTVAALVFSLATFYLTTWEEYHTKRLYLGVISGPVEGILMIIAVFAISGHHGAI